MVAPFYIADYQIGSGQPCFIIAEAGVNHNGNLEAAYKLIDVAVQAGVNAIKFQTFKAERLVTPDAPKANYQLQTTEGYKSQFEMLRQLELSESDHQALLAYCSKRNILFISTPFDEISADFLADLGVAVFKIPSGEITNLPFLDYVARLGKPMIVSTGMSYLGEVEMAVQTIKKAGNHDIALLHCVSNYPASPAEVNLRAMQTMKAAFDLPIGYSDHTLGLEVSLAAVACGACIVEKHFTLDCTLPGPDHQASLEPDELITLIKGIRTVEAALGHGRKQPVASEINTMAVARKSLVAACNIVAQTILHEDLIAIKRPGTGLSPTMKPFLVGRTLKVDILAGTVFDVEMLV